MAPSDPRQTKFVLDESRIPRAWYNIAADLPRRARRRRSTRARQPIGPDDLAPLFPMALIGQEVSAEREIEIPEPVRDAYRLYRPSPLYRAHRLEKALDTPAHIYYKYEGVSPAGSHKPNTALPQAFYNKEAGRQAPRDRDRRRPVGERAGVRRRPVRPRGQGLHGPRQLRPEAVPPDPDGDLRRGGRGQPVARPRTTAAAVLGRDARTARARSGMAISEAVEDAATRDDTKYALGSVLNHVLLHQTVIGQEAIEQMGMAGE